MQGFHGTPLKAIGRRSTVSTLEEIRIVERGDFFISSGPEYTRRFRMCFDIGVDRFLEVGNPRNDILATCDASVTKEAQNRVRSWANIPDDETKVIVYAPTWRPWGTEILPFEDRDWQKLDSFLEARDAVLVLKGHYREAIAGESGHKRILSSASLPLEWDAQTWLIAADVLITDFSSIFFDYLVLDRPIIYIPYDQMDYEQRIGFVVDPREDFAGPAVRTQIELLDAIEQALSEPIAHAARRAEVNRVHNSLEDGRSSARAGAKLSELLSGPTRSVGQ
jgi:CDP-glycerol glycerophosphotransferase (TagB/SpsB family)